MSTINPMTASAFIEIARRGGHRAFVLAPAASSLGRMINRRPRTPVPGLYLSGQDVMIPGIAGTLWGGMLSAAAIDPRVFKKLG